MYVLWVFGAFSENYMIYVYRALVFWVTRYAVCGQFMSGYFKRLIRLLIQICSLFPDCRSLKRDKI